MKIYKIYLAVVLAVSAAGCAVRKGGLDPNDSLPIPMHIAIDEQAAFAGAGPAGGDRAGLYAVNEVGGNPGKLALSGNQADNLPYTLDGGIWNTPAVPHWKNKNTPADIYIYAPYAHPASVSAHAIEIPADQSRPETFLHTYFLWGKATGMNPSATPVSITAGHLLSCACVKLVPGKDFSPEKLEKAEISIRFNRLSCHAEVDLEKGEMTATGMPAAMTTCQTDGLYKTMVIPQSVSGDLITVAIDGKEYVLQQEFTFLKGKQHTFNVLVGTASDGMNVGISGWEEEDLDNGGTAI